MKGPSRADWLQELAKLSAHQGEGMTTQELAKQHKVPVERMRAMLEQASRMGWLRVDYVVRPSWDGRNRRYTLFTVRKPK